MHVLIVDTINEIGIEKIKELGCTVYYDPALNQDTLIDAIKEQNPNIIIVRSTKINKEHLSISIDLSLIVRAGAGYDNIDVDYCNKFGISVSNCPGRNSVAVAELTIGLMIACDRLIPNQFVDFHSGKWNKKLYSKADGLKNKTLGIIGVGKIGIEVAKRAKNFDLNLIGWSRNINIDEIPIDFVWESSLDEIAKKCDIISVHLASNSHTNKILSNTFFENLKNKSIFINTSRSEIVDEDAMIESIKKKEIRVAIDVFEDEPAVKNIEFTNKLQNLPIYVTHHIGASTNQAQEAIADEAINIVQEFVSTGTFRNCINIAHDFPTTYKITIRHFNKPGVLAYVLQILSESKINVEEMQNSIYDGNQSACASLMLSKYPEKDLINKIESHPDVISTKLVNKKDKK